MSKSELTIPKVLQALAAELDHPVSIAEICDLIKSRWSVQYALNSVRASLRWEGVRLGWVKLNRKQYLPLRLALDGLRFRCWPRPQDVVAGRLPIAHLQPFAVFRRQSWPVIYDEQGNVLSIEEPRPHTTGFAAQPVVVIEQWFQRHNFAAGDSILVEVRYRTQPELHFSYESAADFRSGAVAAQDRELVNAIVEKVNEGLRACEDIILPVFANAPWRTGYPGRPWQYLVLSDSRLTLIEDALLEAANTSFELGRTLIQRASPDDVIFHQSLVSSPVQLPVEQAVLDEIIALQQAMQQSRDQDKHAGLWDGELARKSWQADTAEVELWADADDFIDVFFSVSDEKMCALQRLQEVLPAEVNEQLARATSEEVEVILSSQLNYLLVKAPELFPKLDLRAASTPGDTLIDQRSVADTDMLFDDDSLSYDADDDDLFADWDSDWDDEDDDEDDEEEIIFAASGQSDNLMNLYCDYLQEMGKRRSTALFQSRLLKPYAQFLATFYYQSLDQGSYATLDEFLFYYYPHHNNVSERYIREMCGSMRHFYAFLRDRGVIADDRFAQAIWQRRDQAARLMTLYRRVERDYPDHERLMQMLFAPYVS
ncbi:hypothetical protein [uncultured Chloroflexus sp.]|uniref:hypothetical protein n=1 Tax=uncultured Chloroflexus sp. TaxID=214040 RepID=UPI002627E6D1|nr:hypothetical protein [uncultured Chloroflexus sp.]